MCRFFAVEAAFGGEDLEVRKIFTGIGMGLGALLVSAFVALSVMAGGPKDALYMLRYALPHMHRGNLKVGDSAPDARIYALDGAETFHIRERTGAKPLVVIFGSFT
jgi:hypothetical protein